MAIAELRRKIREAAPKEPFALIGTSGRAPTPEETRGTAILFAQIFSEPPWGEVSRCEGCGAFSEQRASQGCHCSTCGTGVLVPAYPVEQMIRHIDAIASRRDASLHIIKEDGIQGFGWGYPRDVADFIGSSIPYKSQRRAIKEVLCAMNGGSNIAFGAEEVGVRPEFRGRGAGKFLISKLVEDGQRQGRISLVWTRWDAVLAPICLNFGYTQVYGPEMCLREGGFELTGQILVGTHPRMSERVLFAAPR